MEHQTVSHFALPVALPVINASVKTIALSIVSNILLTGPSLAERRIAMSAPPTTDEMHCINNMFTDAITLLVMLLRQYVQRGITHSRRAAVLEGVTCLFVATSRVGLGLHMVCETLAAIRFQQSRESLRIGNLWVAIIIVCSKVAVYKRALRVDRASESALLTSAVMRYRVDAIISFITVASGLGKQIAWLGVVSELAKSLLLLQSGIVGVVSACASLHDNINKLRIED